MAAGFVTSLSSCRNPMGTQVDAGQKAQSPFGGREHGCLLPEKRLVQGHCRRKSHSSVSLFTCNWVQGSWGERGDMTGLYSSFATVLYYLEAILVWS